MEAHLSSVENPGLHAAIFGHISAAVGRGVDAGRLRHDDLQLLEVSEAHEVAVLAQDGVGSLAHFGDEVLRHAQLLRQDVEEQLEVQAGTSR